MVINDNYVRVKECCASCVNKQIDEDGIRRCLLTGKRVRTSGLCENWRMSEEMKTADYKQGRIKSRAYQLYVMKVRGEEAEMMAQGFSVTPVSAEKLRYDFMAGNGKLFIEF